MNFYKMEEIIMKKRLLTFIFFAWPMVAMESMEFPSSDDESSESTGFDDGKSL